MTRCKSSVARPLMMTLVCSLVSLGAIAERSTDFVWTSITAIELEAAKAPGLSPWIQPQKYQAVQLSAGPLAGILAKAPMELTAEAESGKVVLTLPTPDGQFESFEIVVSPIMAPELEAWMAEQGWPMRTFRGVSLDHPATSVRLDFGGPAGFHASVHSPQRSYYVDPYWKGDRVFYTSYFRSEYVRKDHQLKCLLEDEGVAPSGEKSGVSTGGNLRTYRLVVAATGEYTAFHGGTAVAGQAAIVTTIARVNQVYENDLSIRMILVANNQDVVFTNSTTDPYTNNNGPVMLGQNQIEVDATIGTANYDIGHVVSTGGGGIAHLQSPCKASSKARGVTGLPSPVGDQFDIDFVSHEMGHQWGGNHTFNSETGGCGGGNRTAGTAYEPGSGSTIQAYAGLCGADNIQSQSDPYFHGISLDQILNYSAGTGGCSINISAGNANAPTVDAGGAKAIPIGTPFELSVVSSNDADGDDMTYTWEEFDLGPGAALSVGDNGSSPIFRSWSPTTSSSQTFPNNGVSTATGETLPTTDRQLNFRVTVRDNNSGGGRIGEDNKILVATPSAGPFLVTAPNGGETWDGAQTVTWDVAGTDAGLVSTANVDIFLSTDGGATWPTTLLSGTPNDGTQSVTLPDVATFGARIKIVGSGNVFYDISDGNFAIGVVNETLFDQGSVCDGSGSSSSQYFSDFSGGSELADDFVVPNGEQWIIGGVSVTGSFSAAGPFTSVNVYVWSDAGGLPGTVLSGCSHPAQGPSSLTDPNIAVGLPGTCVLDPGTYWLEVQGVMPFSPSGQWFWTRNTGTSGYEFAFRDQLNLLGTGCTDWTVQNACLGAVAETELCFSITGSPGSGGIFSDDFETGSEGEWSSSTP